MRDTKETPPNAARFGTRRLSNLFIAVFLAFQIGMPLRYYFGEHGYDERFSWRMFSTVRLQQCEMQISERGTNADPAFREVQVRRDVQAAWVNLLERVRMPVVEKYLERRCERQHATEVSYTRRCKDTNGSALPVQILRMDCSSRELHEASP
jgi:uncharacterized membrane protein